jgi:2-oxoisovalerate dehydrogenase E2 component (dihydrolipoyl transacylase)
VLAAAQPGEGKKSVGKALAAPAVRVRAQLLGIDLSGIAGSGPHGQVIHADLDRALLSRPARVAAKPAAAIPLGRFTETKMIGLRRIIAERMADANRRIPHFTYVEEVDVTALEGLRATLNSGLQNPHLTVLAFIARAVLDALGTHKHLNSLFDDGEGRVRTYEPVHLGIATQTARGLLVPVIRDAQALSLNELASAIARASEAARQGAARREDLMGSTITISSLGALGGIMATPIINPPEVAIVGVNRIVERPVVRDDGTVTARKMMNLSSSFDHRVIDGHDAAAFISTVRERLETPEPLMGDQPRTPHAQQSES